MTDLLFVGIAELVTNAEGPARNGLLGVVRDAAVAVRDGRVAWSGPRGHVPADYRHQPVIDLGGRAVLPGFVDAHTHLVFAGDRAGEFARRLRGESYAEVLATGGGIHATVRATRAAGRAELTAATRRRLRRMLAAGSTTVEVKSGYGLEVATERRQLEVVADLDRAHPPDLVPTFLGAHVVAEEFAADRGRYLDLLETEMLPACAPLARYCDVFCDEGAFTVEEARRVLEAGRRHGLRPRLHANELAPGGGALLAAEVGAVSADHLLHVDRDDLDALAAAGTVAVLLPATSFSLRAGYSPATAIWEAGVTVALGTDCNPGTSYTESMPFVVALACLAMGLSPEQAVWAATRGGALALELADRGHLAAGAVADLVVLDAPSYLHLPYRPGTNLVQAVIKGGRLVAGTLS